MYASCLGSQGVEWQRLANHRPLISKNARARDGDPRGPGTVGPA